MADGGRVRVAAAGRGRRARHPIVEVERPANAAFGDLATNLAMKLARPLRRAPLDIAEQLAAAIGAGGSNPLIASAEVARPGFLNLRVADAAYEGLVAGILAAPAQWGRIPAVNPRAVNVEFVSANPTGPLTVGNARGAFVGDLLCRVLEAGGQSVTREYYFNDSGAQVTHLGDSVVAVRRGEPVPEDGYKGAYVEDLARELPDDVWQAATADGAAAGEVVGAWASARVREGIEASLTRLGVRFDVWKSEASLHDEGWVERAVERLREGGHVYEQDGATWFRSTAFGDDKDRVIYRSDGRPTYFAADIGYVTEKFSRGFDHLIYIWGVDHHGTIARNKNAAQAMGYDPDALPGAADRLGPLRRRRRRGLDVEARGDVRDARRPARRRGHRRRPLVLRLAGGPRRLRLRHRAGEEAVARTTPSTTSSTRTPGSRRSCARPRRPACHRPTTSRASWPASPRRRSSASSRGCPRSWRTRSCAEETQGDHGLRDRARDPVPRLLPRRPGRGSGRAGAIGQAPRAGAATQVTLANALGLLGISAPESM